MKQKNTPKTGAGKLLPLLSVLLCICRIGNAQTLENKTDAYVQLMMARQHVPGLTLAVLKNGKILKIKGYGAANVETGQPATPQTVYRLASISKQFIAAAVMLLKQDNKINLDATINQYLDSPPPAWGGITVRNLLSHTSGLVRDAPDFDPLKVRPLAEDISAIYKLPLEFMPGTKSQYSNMNYYVLAAIIQKITGSPWADWISNHLFKPCGMSQTRTVSMVDIIPNRASGYARTPRGIENADIWLVLRPSGAFCSSAVDMAKWDSTLCTDGLLTAESKKQMWAAMKLNDGTNTDYGFGWFIDSTNSHPRVHHSGGVPGFAADVERFVDDKLTVIVLTNMGGCNAEAMAQTIAGFFMPALTPEPEKPIADTQPGITAKVKNFIATLQQQQRIDTATLEPGLAKMVTMDNMRGMADAVSGKIYSITLVGRAAMEGRRRYRYRLDYGMFHIDLIIAFNAMDKIIGYGTDD